MTRQTFTDQLGFEVAVNHPPRRIVSLVPSQTELLFHLGLDEEIAGITYFCIHPEDKFREKSKIGGTKKVKIEDVKALEPDLIIANKEENEKEQVDALKAYFPVWVSHVYDMDSALDMISKVGAVVGKKEEAIRLVQQINNGFRELPQISPLKTLYFIWRKPYMAAGGDTFIHYVMSKVGLKNALRDQTRYPELTTEEIQRIAPALILLSSEPYPFKERHINELQQIVPNAEIKLVDGSMFSWYGSRMLKAVDYLQELSLDLMAGKPE